MRQASKISPADWQQQGVPLPSTPKPVSNMKVNKSDSHFFVQSFIIILL